VCVCAWQHADSGRCVALLFPPALLHVQLESMVPLCLAPEVTKVTAVECFNDQLLPVFDAFVHCIHRGSTVQCGHASVGDSESWEQDAAAEGEECTVRSAWSLP